jgi:hypothetical protein
MTFNVGSLVPFLTGEQNDKIPKNARIILLMMLLIIIAIVIFQR